MRTATKKEGQQTRTRKTGVKLGVKKLYKDAVLPTKATPDSACYDLFVHGKYEIYFHGVFNRYLINTGIALDIPKGYHVELYLRSGIALKTSLRLANHVGIIDSDYTGEIKLIVENIQACYLALTTGMRIAQMRLVKNEEYELVEVAELPENSHGGFGSTGV